MTVKVRLLIGVDSTEIKKKIPRFQNIVLNKDKGQAQLRAESDRLGCLSSTDV